MRPAGNPRERPAVKRDSSGTIRGRFPDGRCGSATEG